MGKLVLIILFLVIEVSRCIRNILFCGCRIGIGIRIHLRCECQCFAIVTSANNVSLHICTIEFDIRVAIARKNAFVRVTVLIVTSARNDTVCRLNCL